MGDESIAKMPFEASGWGCRATVNNLADEYNLEWIWKNEGGGFIFEHIEGKVRGTLGNIKRFRGMLDNIFN